MHTSITTLGELKKSGWESVSVKEEMRRNLIKKIEKKEPLFPGILGYDKSVIPQIQQAILARHDLILLGLRGQAKTRILRTLTDFLDEYLPFIEGSEINDDPLNPVSVFGRKQVTELGDKTPIAWLHRSSRYGEKLATPDTTVADLIGDLDPIKAAANRLNLSDEQVINFGLIPAANRGIFVINELPDLQPRIQVALLNIMQERDIQIRGFNIRIPLDLMMAFSANPEDYTNRGNIITPLKDRIDSQIITHYPTELETGKKITSQEAWVDRNSKIRVHVPESYLDILEYVAFEARKSEYVDQKSGVSTRMNITAMEQMVSSAERRALINGEKETTLRITDLYSIIPALTGKLELVYEGEQEGAINVAKHLVGRAVSLVFKSHYPDPKSKKEGEKNPFNDLIAWFTAGNDAELSSIMTEKEYKAELDKVEGLKKLVTDTIKPKKEDLYAWMDLTLEGLHQNSILGRVEMDGKSVYSDMLGSYLGSMSDFDDEDEDEDYFQGQ